MWSLQFGFQTLLKSNDDGPCESFPVVTHCVDGLLVRAPKLGELM